MFSKLDKLFIQKGSSKTAFFNDRATDKYGIAKCVNSIKIFERPTTKIIPVFPFFCAAAKNCPKKRTCPPKRTLN